MSSTPPGAAAPAPPPSTVACTINGRPHTFPRGTLIVDAVRQVGHPIPYYCYHPKLAPVGACRVCMVQVEGPPVAARGPIVTTGCTTPVFEGLKIETMSEPAKLARRQVLQFLLINHPLDCPVCDKGGECDLQDFTLGYGPGVSEFAEPKVLRRKAADLGPFLVLDQERCIMCQRCVRYESEVLGEQNLVLKERGDRTVIDTGQGEPYAGYFSGNNTELCPVGALTSRTYRFKARPWDVHPVASVCQGCSLGCNVTAQTRAGRIVRLMLRDNPAVDGGWLCDRGRYGFGHSASPDRLTAPLVRRDGRLVPASWDEAMAAAAGGLRRAGGAAVRGGARLTDEEAVLLAELTRVSLRTNDVDWRVGRQRFAAPEAVGARGAAIADLDGADLVVLADTCLVEEAPVLEIRLRRAASRRTAVLDVGPVRNFRIGRSTRVPCPPDGLAAALASLGPKVAAAARPVVIWNGRGSEDVAEAVRALGAPVLVPGEWSNARGAEKAGLVPDALPGYHALDDAAPVEAAWGASVPRHPGRDARAILEAAAAGSIGGLYLVGANPLRTFPDGGLAAAALDKVPFLVVQDLFMTEAAAAADVVLPATGPLEKAGHVTNLAGNRQTLAAVAAGPGGARSDGDIFHALAAACGVALTGRAPEVATEPVRRVLTPGGGPPAGPGGGALRLLLRTRLYAGGGTTAFDPNLAPLREDAVLRLHPRDAAAAGLEDGGAAYVKGGGSTLTAAVRVDPDVDAGHAELPAHGFGPTRLGAWVDVQPAPAEALPGRAAAIAAVSAR